MTVLTPRQAQARASAPQAATTRGRPFTLDSLTMASRRHRVTDIEKAVEDATHEATMVGSSTVTITLIDPDWQWTTSSLFTTRSVLSVDGQPFSLAAVRRQGQRLEATFEAWLVAALRRPNAPRKFRRSAQMTRARAAAQLVQEIPGAAVFAPEMLLRQPVSKPDQAGRIRPYEFRRGEGGQRESSWDALQRWAEEVGWRCFDVGGVIWFVSDDWLMAQPPALVVTPTSSMVEDIGFTHDTGLADAEATLAVLAERWALPPGARIDLRGCGAASGPWLIESTRRPLASPHAEVTLTRRHPRLPEPAPETEHVSASSPDASSFSLAAGGPIAPQALAAYRRAEDLATKGMTYVRGTADCSWWVSEILIAGGMLGGRLATGGLMTWGQAGRGRNLTVWVKDTPGSPFAGSHTYIEFTGFPHTWSEAGGGIATNGWRSSKDTAGYNARCYPGV